MKSDEALLRVLRGYQRRMAEEALLAKSLPRDEYAARLDEFLLTVGEEVANLLRDLVVGLGAKMIVELGTAYGYSTLFLADAARRTGGKVFTYEKAADKQAYARKQLTEAGLSGVVEWRLGDALELLREQPGPIDFALIDVWKDLYVTCFDRVYPLLAPNGVIVADNMFLPESGRVAAAAYRAAVRAKPDMQAVLLPIGQGIDISCRVATR